MLIMFEVQKKEPRWGWEIITRDDVLIISITMFGFEADFSLVVR